VTKFFRISLAATILVLCSAAPCFSNSTSESSKAQLYFLSQVDASAQPAQEKIRQIESDISNSDEVVKAYALVIKYRESKLTREEVFPGIFDIFNYSTPSSAASIEYESFLGIVKEIEGSIDTSKCRKCTPLIAYFHFRKNPAIFVAPDGKRYSAGTLMRSAFLSSVFTGSEVDTIDFLGKIRARAANR
jgi:hypothetical protein